MPFSEPLIEAQAFPALVGHHGSTGWSGQSDAIFGDPDAVEQLRAYTMLRLYSVNPKWRKNSDYVIFAMHRLAAFGSKDFADAVSKLPPPLSPAEIEALPSVAGHSASFELKIYD